MFALRVTIMIMIIGIVIVLREVLGLCSQLHTTCAKTVNSVFDSVLKTHMIRCFIDAQRSAL